MIKKTTKSLASLASNKRQQSNQFSNTSFNPRTNPYKHLFDATSANKTIVHSGA